MSTLPNRDTMREYLISRTLDHLIERLMADHGFTMPQAIDLVYTSPLIVQLQDPIGELYVQSPDYVYDMLEAEV